MTYADQFDRLSLAVAGLLQSPSQPMDELGVQAALSGRKALLGLLTAQLAEAVPLDRSVTRPDIQTLARHPVAALIGTLRDYPRPHSELAPSTLYSAPQTTPAGALWVEVGRRSTLAVAEWQGLGDALSDEQAWDVVGDAAALAGVLSRLDGDLYASAQDEGCGDLVRGLTAPVLLRLALAATEVRRLAGEPRQNTLPSRSRAPEPRIRAVGRDSDVPPALHALAELLRRTPLLKPEQVQQVAISLARVELCRNARRPTDLARALGEVAKTHRRAACPFQGDRRPVLQAAELNRWVSRSGQSTTVGADALGPALHACVRQLQSAARRQVQSGHWLVPDPNPDAQHIWRNWTNTLPEPEILLALRTASQSLETRPGHGGYTLSPRNAQVALAGLASAQPKRRPPSPRARPLGASR